MFALLFKYTILCYLLPPAYRQELDCFDAYVRTRAAGIPKGYAPWHTDFGTKSSVLHLDRGVHALPVRTYAAIAPNAAI